MSWTKLEEKVVIVTGGAAGIGLAVTKGFVEVGAKVMIADFAEDVGARAVEEANQAGSGEAAFAKCDVTSKAEVDQLIEKTVERWGSVDALVNNAGINVPRLLVDPAGKEELTLFFNVTLSFCNAATKAANQNLTRSWAKELGSKGIRVVGVAPGIMETTSMRSDAYEESLAYTRGVSVEKLRSNDGSSIPLGRSGKLSEVSDLVVYLVSDRASYLHGTTVNISGGKSRG